jgi:hypothetical protein
VNASVVGPSTKLIVGDTSTFTRMDLVKSNSFYSQWCATQGASAPAYQQASVRPTVNLFKDPQYGLTSAAIGNGLGAANGLSDYTRARMQPRINVGRTEFEDAKYANGSTLELAGRGLYGEYALFIPSAVISHASSDGSRTNGLDLDAVEDILIRFDYVSVAK